MKSSVIITGLICLCGAELALIIGLVGGNLAFPTAEPESGAAKTAKSPIDASLAKTPGAAGSRSEPLTPAELLKKNEALAVQLAEVKKELDERKSEISFSYGSIRDSGRFVGMTFRKMFEAAATREATEAQAKTADNQINVLSLGPFIQDAEVMESDPVAFAQFQAPLISEVLGLAPERGGEIEAVLSDLKRQSLQVEEGSAEWVRLNDAALQRITAMVSESQRQALKPQLDFLQQYGVLMIPAYSILRAPTPTIAPIKR